MARTPGPSHRRSVAPRVPDLIDTVRIEDRLAASEEHFRLLAENSSDLVFRSDRGGRIEWMSTSVHDTLGWEVSDLVGQRATDFVHPDDRHLLPADADVIAGQRTAHQLRVRTAYGGYLWMSVVIRLVTDETGEVVGRVGSAHDIQAEVAARQAAARSEQQLRLTMAATPAGLALVDLDRHFLQVNPALARLVGRDESWLIAHGMADLLDPESDEVDLRMRDELRSGDQGSMTSEKCLLRADGSRVWVEHSIALIRDENGWPQSYVSQFVDVTQAKQERDRLDFLATHDPLTQLLNRTALQDQVARIANHPPRSGNQLGVLFIDIDRFKDTNDHHGHQAGDEVLLAVGQRAAASARADDLVARIGGDEIVVVLPAIRTAADAEAVASKIKAAVSRPVTVAGGSIHPTVSIGIAVAEPDAGAAQIISRADKALYRAKRSGRDRTATYTPGIDDQPPQASPD